MHDDDWLDLAKLAGVFVVLPVAWGIFYSVLAPILATFQRIGAALGWSDTQLGWVGLLLDQLRFGWTTALFMIAVTVSYVLLFGLIVLAFRTTRLLNERRLAYFAEQHPADYVMLEDSVGSISANVAVWYVCTVGVWLTALVAYFLGVRSATWVVAGSVTAVLGVFYVAMLVDASDLGRWAFHHVRGFILPYVFVVTPVFVLFAFISLLQGDILVEFYSFFGTDPGWMSGWISRGFTRDFEWQPIDLLRALAASLASLLVLVWVAPIVIKRDFLKLGAIALAFASPWLGAQLLASAEGAQQHLAQLLDVVPLPVLALASAIVVDWLFGALKGSLTESYVCPVCANRSRPEIRYCPQCGTRKTKSAVDEQAAGVGAGAP